MENAVVRLLVVEDEPKLADLLERGLGEDGHVVDVASTGTDALWMARVVSYDAIVLDVMLPGRDGFTVCAELREAGVSSPSTHADCSRRRRGSRGRARQWGRRLPDEALRVPSSMPVSAPWFDARRSRGPLCSRSAASASIRRRDARGTGS